MSTLDNAIFGQCCENSSKVLVPEFHCPASPLRSLNYNTTCSSHNLQLPSSIQIIIILLLIIIHNNFRVNQTTFCVISDTLAIHAKYIACTKKFHRTNGVLFCISRTIFIRFWNASKFWQDYFFWYPICERCVLIVPPHSKFLPLIAHSVHTTQSKIFICLCNFGPNRNQ